MKKLILTLAILANGFSVFAFSSDVFPLGSPTVYVDEGFTEVTLDKLPEVVRDEVLKNYANATLTRAYVNKKEQYKLELKIEKTTNVVYIDKEGYWLEEIDIKNVGGD